MGQFVCPHIVLLPSDLTALVFLETSILDGASLHLWSYGAQVVYQFHRLHSCWCFNTTITISLRRTPAVKGLRRSVDGGSRTIWSHRCIVAPDGAAASASSHAATRTRIERRDERRHVSVQHADAERHV